MKYAIIGSGKIVVDLTNAFHVAPEEMPFMLLRKSWEVSCLLKSCPRHLSEHAPWIFGIRMLGRFNFSG